MPKIVAYVPDYVIDLGPDGGEEGGRVVASGTPEEVSLNTTSYTGAFLKRKLSEDSQLQRETVPE